MIRGYGLLLCILASGCGVEKSVALLSCPVGTRLVDNRCRGPINDQSTLRISPMSLNFGGVQIGSRQSLTLEVINLGTSEATARWGDLGSNLLQSAVENQDIVIPPQGQSTVLVSFTPNRAGPVQVQWPVRTCEGGCEQIIRIEGAGFDISSEDNPLVCEPVDFGRTPVGSCTNDVVYCFNASVRPLTVVNISTDGTDESIFVDGPFQEFIPAEGDLLVPMVFCPRQPGLHTARVDIYLQGVDAPATATAVGTGGEDPPTNCNLQFPARVEFGLLGADTPSSQTLRATNVGSSPCVVQLSLDGSAYFRVVTPNPIEILPQRSASIQLDFAGAPGGNYEAQLRMEILGDSGGITVGPVQLTADVIGGPIAQLNAQCVPSAYVAQPTNPQPLVWAQNSDDGYSGVPIPFPFAVFGRPINVVYVSSNGFIAFRPEGVGSPGNTSLPDTSSPNQLIAWWWDDLNPGASGPQSATSNVEGPPGQRILRLRFTDLQYFGDDRATVNAEVRLLESNSSVEVYYGSSISGPGNRLGASVGWDGLNGLTGGDVLGCSPRCTGRDWPTGTMCTYSDAP